MIFTIKKIIQGNSTDQPINKQPTSDTDNQAIVHTKEDFMSLYSYSFTGLGKFQVEPCHIAVDPSVPLKKIPCRPVSIYQQAAIKQQLSEMHATGIIKPVSLVILLIVSLFIVNNLTSTKQ